MSDSTIDFSSTKTAQIVDEPGKTRISSTKMAKNMDEPRKTRGSSINKAKIMDEIYSAAVRAEASDRKARESGREPRAAGSPESPLSRSD